MKSFKEFLKEASFVGKAFALLQRSQLQKRRSQLHSLGQKISDLGKGAMRETDEKRRLYKIAEAIVHIGSAIQINADLSSNLMDASITGVIDSKDITKAVDDALRRRK